MNTIFPSRMRMALFTGRDPAATYTVAPSRRRPGSGEAGAGSIVRIRKARPAMQS
jgi:hypothetical protein